MGNNASFLKKLDIKGEGGLNRKAVEKVWGKYDTNGDGELDEEEATQFFSDLLKAHGEELTEKQEKIQIRRLIKKFDLDGDGKISKEELMSEHSAALDVVAEIEAEENQFIGKADTHVFIQSLTGKKFAIEIDTGAESLRDLREKINDHEGIPKEQIRLMVRNARDIKNIRAINDTGTGSALYALPTPRDLPFHEEETSEHDDTQVCEFLGIEQGSWLVIVLMLRKQKRLERIPSQLEGSEEGGMMGGAAKLDG